MSKGEGRLGGLTREVVPTSNPLSISQLRVSKCWVHCIVSTLHFGACPVWLFVFHFAVPGRARYFLLLLYLWLVSCLFYHFLFVIHIFTNDSAYFVSFCNGFITQKRAPGVSVVPAAAKVHANKCAASTTQPLGPGKPSAPSHPIPPSRRFPSPNHQLLPPSPLWQYPPIQLATTTRTPARPVRRATTTRSTARSGRLLVPTAVLQLTLLAPKHTVEHVEAIILYQRTRDMTDFKNSGGRALFVYTSTGLARQRKTIPLSIDNGAFELA
jgi:hypothetical protein